MANLLIETLYEQSNIDAKCILNRSTKVIDKTILDKIESEGATSEILETLGVPVFRYKTQITIHGKFSKLNNHYLGGYKNLFQNKNDTIGIKWQAVDFSKKNEIYTKVSKFNNDFWINKNSTAFELCKTSKRFRTKDEYLELLKPLQTEIENIDKSLYHGTAGVYLMQSYTDYYLLTCINIGTVRQTNVNKLIESICNDKIENIDKVILEKEALKLQELNEYRRLKAIKYDEEVASLKAMQEKALSSYTNLTVEKVAISEGLVTVNLYKYANSESEIFVKKVYSKPKGKREFRVIETKIDKIDFSNDYTKDDFLSYKAKICVSGVAVQTFVFTNLSKTENKIEVQAIKENKENKNTVKPSKKETINNTTILNSGASSNSVNSIQILDYSDKSFAVIGDTKKIKDSLKSLGGAFNFRLTCGAGWIFSKTKKETVENFLLTI